MGGLLDRIYLYTSFLRVEAFKLPQLLRNAIKKAGKCHNAIEMSALNAMEMSVFFRQHPQDWPAYGN